MLKIMYFYRHFVFIACSNVTSLTTILLLLLPLVSLYFCPTIAIGALLDEACTDNSNCTNVTNSICSAAKKCQCIISTHYKHNSVTCKPKIAFGSNCTANIQCDETNTMCKSKCKCIDSHFRNSTTCSPRIAPSKSCGNRGNSSCVTNAYCNHTTTGFCVCGENFQASSTSCNAAMTMAVVEISTIIMCFLLAYLEVLK